MALQYIDTMFTGAIYTFTWAELKIESAQVTFTFTPPTRRFISNFTAWLVTPEVTTPAQRSSDNIEELFDNLIPFKLSKTVTDDPSFWNLSGEVATAIKRYDSGKRLGIINRLLHGKVFTS